MLMTMKTMTIMYTAVIVAVQTVSVLERYNWRGDGSISVLERYNWRGDGSISVLERCFIFGSLGLLCTPRVSSWSAHVHYVHGRPGGAG